MALAVCGGGTGNGAEFFPAVATGHQGVVRRLPGALCPGGRGGTRGAGPRRLRLASRRPLLAGARGAAAAAPLQSRAQSGRTGLPGAASQAGQPHLRYPHRVGGNPHRPPAPLLDPAFSRAATHGVFLVDCRHHHYVTQSVKEYKDAATETGSNATWTPAEARNRPASSRMSM